MAKGLINGRWYWPIVGVLFAVILGSGQTSCNDARIEAIAAEEKIKTQVCEELFPAIYFNYSKNDTPETKNNMEYLGNIRDAYCNG